METSIYADYNLTGIYTSDQKMGYKLYIYIWNRKSDWNSVMKYCCMGFP
jgi:hypothetical protein